ncbi:MAG TPA: TIGR03564 family F420-dependent LLM class oxidoreductase [Acidimicrobiales bacterium]|jgi:F420-dependent oxidoreductase-like protein|nr:TIGR03564 family F420-dependent LLM class oxidoreductase [Acidimicrobiales bacterium]
MRYGVMLDQFKPIDDVIGQARSIAAQGYSSVWLSQVFGYDALTLLALIGREVPGVELGTGVVPIYPRHPLTLAAQALTTQAASAGRLALGIGLSHQVVVEGMWGYSFDKPVRAMREYLAVLNPALRGEQVQFEGETVKAMTMGPLNIRVDGPPALLIAALGPAMLKLTGEQADGTVTWMTGPGTLEGHIVPALTAAAEAAGRPAPRIVAALPVCITSDVDAARAQAAKVYAIYGTLPSYRAMLDREGAAGPADVAIAGDEATVAKAVDRLADAGVTDFVATQLGTPQEWAATLEFLARRFG